MILICMKSIKYDLSYSIVSYTVKHDIFHHINVFNKFGKDLKSSCIDVI